MSEPGRAYAATISAGSNTTVKSTSGSLYRVNWSKPTGAAIRIENSANLGATPDLNATGADTIFSGTAATTDFDIPFGPGVSFRGLAIAATSNARVNIVYE